MRPDVLGTIDTRGLQPSRLVLVSGVLFTPPDLLHFQTKLAGETFEQGPRWGSAFLCGRQALERVSAWVPSGEMLRYNVCGKCLHAFYVLQEKAGGN